MNALLEKFNEFKEINNFVFKYFLESGLTISYTINQRNFPHLLGLQYLVDIPLLQNYADETKIDFTAMRVISAIKKEKLTDKMVRSSKYFEKINDRYDFLTKEAILSLSFNEIILDFDNTLAYSNLNSIYLLIEKKGLGTLHFGLRKDGNIFTPETFFFRNDDQYTKGQKIINIKRIQIFDSKNCCVLDQII